MFDQKDENRVRYERRRRKTKRSRGAAPDGRSPRRRRSHEDGLYGIDDAPQLREP